MTTTSSRPERLYLIEVAALPAPDHMPAVCYLIQTSDGRNILVDSGLPSTLPPGMPELVRYGTVVEQLAQIGVQPEAVDTVICTHFDIDHVGEHATFHHAQFVVQHAHNAVARHEQRFARTRQHWDLPGMQYRLVDGDTELLPGLQLIETSGHVPGHQSVLVHLPQTGPVLLTIDAVPDQQSFRLDRQPGPRDLDPEGTRISTQKLLDLTQQAQIALVIFGHDGQQWQTLKKLPHYYC